MGIEKRVTLQIVYEREEKGKRKTKASGLCLCVILNS